MNLHSLNELTVQVFPLYPSDALHIGIGEFQLPVTECLADEPLQLPDVQADIVLQERDALPDTLYTLLLQFFCLIK